LNKYNNINFEIKMSRARLAEEDEKDKVFDYKVLESKIYPKRGSLDQKSLIKCG
jgi:hypothetical protein